MKNKHPKITESLWGTPFNFFKKYQERNKEKVTRDLEMPNKQLLSTKENAKQNHKTSPHLSKHGQQEKNKSRDRENPETL